MVDQASAKPRSFFGHPMAKWGLFMLALFVLWFAGWFGIARFADGKIGQVISGLNQRGIAIDCGSRAIIGFPFRLGVSCDGLTVVDSVHDFRGSVSGVKSAAQLYAPRKNIVELASPLAFSASGQDVQAEWDLMRLYLEPKGNGFKRISVNWRDLKAQTRQAQLNTVTGALHARPNPDTAADLDLAGSANDLVLNGEDKFRASISYDVQMKGGYRTIIEGRQRPADWLRDGGEIMVRSLFVALPEGGKLALSGPLTVNANGMLNGSVRFGLDEADALASFVSEVNPEFGPIVLGLSQGINMLGKETAFGDRMIRAVTVGIEDGWTKVGPFKLGRLPPVF